MIRYIYEGEMRPFFWGYVDYDWLRDARRIAPMPFNWIIRWAVKFERWASKKSHRTLTEEELANHHEYLRITGKIKRDIDLEAYNRGYERGFGSGWESYRRNMLDKLEEMKEGT